MRKKITIVLVCLFILVGIPVQAKGNEWILDESEVISSETEAYISNLNETVFSAYQRKPQLGFMIIDRLPSGYTMDEYKLEQFNLYGVGTKEENCGMLFIFAIQDRKYGLEIGDGFEKGSLLRKELEQDFITSNMKNMLREENYDGVVFQVTKHLENIMADEEHGIYAQRERELKEKEQEFREKDRITNIVLLTIIGVIGLFVLIFKTVCYLPQRRTVQALLESHQRYIFLIY
ncbi:MAG: TPM domain-containing protein [Lachnospiraceae bacterium]|nr:TPM domain-containing protein [Lachnospiraceae bacterium]